MKFGASSEQIEDNMNQLFSAIFLEQRKIAKIRPAQEDKLELQQNMVQEYAELKGQTFTYNYMSSGRGHGPFTELIDGSVKYNLIGSMGVNLLGHSHPLYIRAHLEAATHDTFTCGNLLSYPDALEFSRNIINASKGSRLKHFWFSCSGSMANDTALKIIWQKKIPKRKIISFERAFAGRTIAQQNITHNKAYSEGMPNLIDVHHIPFYDLSHPEQAIAKTLNDLETLWRKEGDEFAAINIELVQGEAGFIWGTSEYYKAIFEWASQKDILIWIDEIQTFARTKNLFAFQMFDLEKYVDVVTIGKALQVCGTLYTDELNPRPGLVGGTFSSPLASLKVANKILHYLIEGPFYGSDGRIAQLEKEFLTRFAKITCPTKIINARGIGAMISFEVGNSSAEITKKFLNSLFENGIIAYSAGKNPTRVRFLLPLALRTEHIDEIFNLLEKTAREVL